VLDVVKVEVVTMLSVVVVEDVDIVMVVVFVSVVVSHTYSYGGAVVYFGMAVLGGGSVVQQVASTSS